ncbi:hypothetical protein WISP_112407 [Willisornis vidua]|uniref:Uncharacterized protein n=1 Tax=Willisornis vidua TaxID=1566151 RepID=A0ABQ9CZZ2_9PASS|nr:hypothetical protein WISP_112407 [Willisornis vidua]
MQGGGGGNMQSHGDSPITARSFLANMARVQVEKSPCREAEPKMELSTWPGRASHDEWSGEFHQIWDPDSESQENRKQVAQCAHGKSESGGNLHRTGQAWGGGSKQQGPKAAPTHGGGEWRECRGAVGSQEMHRQQECEMPVQHMGSRESAVLSWAGMLMSTVRKEKKCNHGPVAGLTILFVSLIYWTETTIVQESETAAVKIDSNSTLRERPAREILLSLLEMKVEKEL